MVAALLVGPAFLWALSRTGLSLPAMARALWRPATGGILMAAVSLFVIRLTGPGWLGLLAAGGAAFAVYLPFVYPLRALLRHPQAGGSGGASVCSGGADGEAGERAGHRPDRQALISGNRGYRPFRSQDRHHNLFSALRYTAETTSGCRYGIARGPMRWRSRSAR